MKRITILFILSIISSSSFAQNWKTVSSSDTTYFSAGTYYAYDGNFLKMIFVDSTSYSNGDSIFHFYNAVRGTDMNQCLDTTAPTWLGSKFIHAANGTEYYSNSVNDSIILKTNALQGDSWTVAEDTTGLVFKATVTSAGVTTIENVTDSFKRATIQAYQNSVPISHHYNGKVLEWTKNHGWLKTLDLYRFPNSGNGWEQFGALVDTGQILRLDNDFAHRDMNYVDLQWKYTPGNEWIYWTSSGAAAVPYVGANKTLQHDSVMTSSMLSPDTIVVTFMTKVYAVGGWVPPQPGPNQYWDSTVTTSVSIHTD